MTPRSSSRPPARCLSLLGELSRYLDEEMTPRQRRAIDAHCRDCARCRRMIAGLRRTIDVCRAAGASRMPGRVRARAAARVREILQSK